MEFEINISKDSYKTIEKFRKIIDEFYDAIESKIPEEHDDVDIIYDDDDECAIPSIEFFRNLNFYTEILVHIIRVETKNVEKESITI